MAEVVNLRLARKARQRELDAASAAANRARHGERKAERTARQTEADREARSLDGARRETD
jgi:hypothetical protein